eukprot:tig00021432_g21233.t1
MESASAYLEHLPAIEPRLALKLQRLSIPSHRAVDGVPGAPSESVKQRRSVRLLVEDGDAAQPASETGGSAGAHPQPAEATGSGPGPSVPALKSHGLRDEGESHKAAHGGAQGAHRSPPRASHRHPPREAEAGATGAHVLYSSQSVPALHPDAHTSSRPHFLRPMAPDASGPSSSEELGRQPRQRALSTPSLHHAGRPPQAASHAGVPEGEGGAPAPAATEGDVKEALFLGKILVRYVLRADGGRLVARDDVAAALGLPASAVPARHPSASPGARLGPGAAGGAAFTDFLHALAAPPRPPAPPGLAARPALEPGDPSELWRASNAEIASWLSRRDCERIDEERTRMQASLSAAWETGVGPGPGAGAEGKVSPTRGLLYEGYEALRAAARAVHDTRREVADEPGPPDARRRGSLAGSDSEMPPPALLAGGSPRPAAGGGGAGEAGGAWRAVAMDGWAAVQAFIKRPAGSHVPILRSTGTVAASPATVASFLWSRRRAWEGMARHVEVLEMLDERTRLEKVTHEALAEGVPPRDFLLATTYRRYAPDRYLVASASVQHPAHPPRPAAPPGPLPGPSSGPSPSERGHVFFSGFYVRPGPPGAAVGPTGEAAQIVHVAQIEYGSLLPSFLQRFCWQNELLNVATLRGALLGSSRRPARASRRWRGRSSTRRRAPPAPPGAPPPSPSPPSPSAPPSAPSQPPHRSAGGARGGAGGAEGGAGGAGSASEEEEAEERVQAAEEAERRRIAAAERAARTLPNLQQWTELEEKRARREGQLPKADARPP